MEKEMPETHVPAEREWDVPLTIDRHIVYAREEMGEARWAALNAEWPA
jgi:hypothetical protein